MKKWYYVKLSEPVATAGREKGSDVAICHADTAAEAVSQLIPEMRACVAYVRVFDSMRKCYLAAGIIDALKGIVR